MANPRIDLADLHAPLQRGATILVPNNRMRDAILQGYADGKGTSVFVTPPVFAIDIWIKTRWDQAASLGIEPFCTLGILSAVEELFIWTQLIEDSLDKYPLLGTEETAAAVSRAYQLMKLWQLDTPDSSAIEAFAGIPDVAAYLHWVQAFTRRCHDCQNLALADATHELTRQLAKATPAWLDRDIVLLNFLEPPPLYAALFEQLGKVSESLSRVQTSPDDGIILPETARRQEFADPDSELTACARWAADHCARDPDAHIGIICNSRESRQPALTRALADALHPQSLFDFGGDEVLFNSAGANRNLMQAGIIQDALLLLGLLQEQQLSDDLCRLLKSPYIEQPEDEQGARMHMELLMRDRFTRRCNRDEFSFYLGQADKPWHCPTLADALLRVRTRLRRLGARASAPAWAQGFAELLTILGWPGARLSRQEQHLLAQWQSVLEQFSRAAVVLGDMDADTALSRLRLLCRQTPEWRESGLHRPISFYSVNEALGLYFDHLWLLGFDDQSWPRPTRPSAFLPYSLQKQAGIPDSHSELQYQLATRDFAVICQSVGGEFIASHYQADGDQEFRPSSFILPLPLKDADSGQGPGLNAYALARRGRHPLLSTSDLERLALDEQEAVRGGHGIISDQSACPFRAFARYRLTAGQLEDFSAGLSRKSRGNAVHVALDELFAAIASRQDLLAMDAEGQKQCCQRAADRAMEYLARAHRHLMTPRFKRIERRRLEQLLEQFLQAEAARGDFQVIAREQRLTWSRRHLQLRLFVDRVDRLADQRLAIIDYKTGKFTPSRQSWLQERPEDLQLPVYSVAAAILDAGEVSAVALAHLNAEKIGYSALTADAHFHPQIKPVAEDSRLQRDWPQLREEFADKVVRFADEFIAGKLAVDPVNGYRTCEYCDLQPLCRIQELEEWDQDDAMEAD